MTADITVTIW